MQIIENNCAQMTKTSLYSMLRQQKTMDSIGIKINTEESSCVPSNISSLVVSSVGRFPPIKGGIK